MIYRVIITPEAETDLRTAYHYIRSYAPHAARDWIRRARQAAQEPCPPTRTMSAGSRERFL